MKRLALILAASAMAFSFLTGPASAEEFSYDDVLPVYLKLDKSLVVDDLVDAYIEKYRPEIWRKYRNDEFELQEKRVETLKIMKDKISNTNLDTQFLIMTNFTFGDYKFGPEKFAFTPFGEGLYFSVSSCCNALPRQINVFFSNPEIVDGIPMPKEEAKNFLNKRKSSYGEINRSILAKLYIIIKEYKGVGKLSAEIQSVELFDKDNRTTIMKVVKK